MTNGPTNLVQVWDVPIRVFHWAIVMLVGFSWLSIELNWIDLHFLSGYTILTLLLFRIVWGIVGSDTARFSRLVLSPVAALRHLAHIGRREPDRQIGHNAAGGWLVLLILALLLVQVGTGLLSNTDGLDEGPLAHLVGKRASDWLTIVHSANFTVLQIAVGLHVLAVLAYAVLKRQDLVRRMLTGRKRLPVSLGAPRIANLWLALPVLALAVGIVVLLVNFA